MVYDFSAKQFIFPYLVLLVHSRIVRWPKNNFKKYNKLNEADLLKAKGK